MEQEYIVPKPSSLQLEEVRIVESFLKLPENVSVDGLKHFKMKLGSAFELSQINEEGSLYSYILKLQFGGMIDDTQEECLVLKTKASFTLDLSKLPSMARERKTVIGLLSYNAPSLVFPYIRSYVASMTAMAGDGALLLPTLDLTPTGANIKQRLEQDEVFLAIQGLD